jgi:hypothetical protein
MQVQLITGLTQKCSCKEVESINYTEMQTSMTNDEDGPWQCPRVTLDRWKGDDGYSGSEMAHDVPRFTSPQWRIATSC